eukprot:TRINITY_DN20639_c0_g1_i1.p1 TRINITY_DN20639_c0_g1~~TRINITY_DN20639_c0_g1_i1.p1  ORF type:complete len:541 (+),score=134.39 TRINITY_DN20639_c0_g1_i1:230-1624(+)
MSEQPAPAAAAAAAGGGNPLDAAAAAGMPNKQSVRFVEARKRRQNRQARKDRKTREATNCWVNMTGVFDRSLSQPAVEDLPPAHPGHPTGTFTTPVGDVYVGGLDDEGKAHGDGEWRFHNGGIYIGQFKRNKRHGLGRLNFRTGDEYVGRWEDSQRHGEGTYISAEQGSTYTGTWRKGKRHDLGQETFRNGDYYRGEWCKDLRHGNGRLQEGGELFRVRYVEGKLMDKVRISHPRASERRPAPSVERDEDCMSSVPSLLSGDPSAAAAGDDDHQRVVSSLLWRSSLGGRGQAAAVERVLGFMGDDGLADSGHLAERSPAAPPGPCTRAPPPPQPPAVASPRESSCALAPALQRAEPPGDEPQWRAFIATEEECSWQELVEAQERAEGALRQGPSGSPRPDDEDIRERVRELLAAQVARSFPCDPAAAGRGDEELARPARLREVVTATRRQAETERLLEHILLYI